MLNEGVNWEMQLGKRPGIRSARGSQRGAELMLWVVGSIVSQEKDSGDSVKEESEEREKGVREDSQGPLE